MNQKTLLLYHKAVNRLKNTGIVDPTSIIAELESEIDSYRTKIRNLEKEQRLNHIEQVIGKINHNHGEITKEDSSYIYVTSIYGTHKYSKLQLAIFWLTHSNDRFFETFGFSWVPSNELQEIARKEISKNSGVEIGVDISSVEDTQIDFEIPLPEAILKDILSDIDPIDIVKQCHSFTSFHTK